MSDLRTELEITLFTTALDHAWNRFNFRISSALQILNYYLVAIAILSGAYVGALTHDLQPVAGFIGIIGSGVSVAAFLGGYGQIRLARMVMPQLRELEVRIATLLSIPDIWDNAPEEGSRLAQLRLSGNVAGAMFGAAFLGGLAAAIYALLYA